MMPVQGGMPPMGMISQGTGTLTDTQQQNLVEVLGNYDTNKLSDDDAKALVNEIKELGLQQNRGLAEALGSAGIDVGELAQQAGIAAPGGQGGAGGPPGGAGGPPGGGKGGPPGGGGAQGAKGPDSAAVQTMQSIVDELQEAASDSDEEDFSTLLIERLQAAGLDTSQPIVDYLI